MRRRWHEDGHCQQTGLAPPWLAWRLAPIGTVDRVQWMRRAMMQAWADYLDQLRHGAQVISMAKAA